MQWRMKHILAGAMVISSASLIGCASHADGPYYGAEPVQSGYAEYPADFNDPYYDQGGYNGAYWVWHDREGYEHREGRAAHEQHMRAPEHYRGAQQRGQEFNRTEHGAAYGAYGTRGAEGRSSGRPEAAHGGGPGGSAHSGGEGHGEAGGAHGGGDDGGHR